ncbi:MAG: hypothetical protein AAB834_07515, partial [Patescibacteria group bacterium]
MTPELLAETIPFARNVARIAETEVMRRGEELKRQYRECADRFRRIVQVTGANRELSGALVTPGINLGSMEH